MQENSKDIIQKAEDTEQVQAIKKINEKALEKSRKELLGYGSTGKERRAIEKENGQLQIERMKREIRLRDEQEIMKLRQQLNL